MSNKNLQLFLLFLVFVFSCNQSDHDGNYNNLDSDTATAKVDKRIFEIIQSDQFTNEELTLFFVKREDTHEYYVKDSLFITGNSFDKLALLGIKKDEWVCFEQKLISSNDTTGTISRVFKIEDLTTDPRNSSHWISSIVSLKARNKFTLDDFLEDLLSPRYEFSTEHTKVFEAYKEQLKEDIAKMGGKSLIENLVRFTQQTVKGKLSKDGTEWITKEESKI